jgi:hypothetical protein
LLGQARLTDLGVDIRFGFAAFGLGEKLVGEEVDPRILPVIGNDGKADPGIRIKAESQDRENFASVRLEGFRLELLSQLRIELDRGGRKRSVDLGRKPAEIDFGRVLWINLARAIRTGRGDMLRRFSRLRFPRAQIQRVRRPSD